jgi:hypothetical protein
MHGCTVIHVAVSPGDIGSALNTVPVYVLTAAAPEVHFVLAQLSCRLAHSCMTCAELAEPGYLVWSECVHYSYACIV